MSFRPTIRAIACGAAGSAAWELVRGTAPPAWTAIVHGANAGVWLVAVLLHAFTKPWNGVDFDAEIAIALAVLLVIAVCFVVIDFRRVHLKILNARRNGQPVWRISEPKTIKLSMAAFSLVLTPVLFPLVYAGAGIHKGTIGVVNHYAFMSLDYASVVASIWLLAFMVGAPIASLRWRRV